MDSSNGFDWIYIVLTLVFSIASAIKSFKNKKQEGPSSTTTMEEEELEELMPAEIIEIKQQQQQPAKPLTLEIPMEELEQIRQKEQQKKKELRDQRLSALFNEQQEETVPETEEAYHLNIRDAIIANEILNRKY